MTSHVLKKRGWQKKKKKKVNHARHHGVKNTNENGEILTGVSGLKGGGLTGYTKDTSNFKPLGKTQNVALHGHGGKGIGKKESVRR